ncbi:MAG: choice-of-anchor J domain-containing protein [Bacteroidaceae bacterium]|nr:choice-of-anchor J domain-containing protein [Bacteroidaceae bacterium]
MRPTKYLAFVAAGLLCSALFTASCSDDPEITVPPVAPGEPFMTDGEALFACDFQNKEVAEQSFTQYNTGNLTPYDPYAIGFTKEKPWHYFIKDDYTSTNTWAGCSSMYNETGTPGLWLVTTGIDIPAMGESTLLWQSQSLDPKKLDGLKVLVSTTGNTPAHFTEAPVWQTEAEPAGNTETMDGEWNDHGVSLKAYAGKRIWIAFVNDTYNGCVLGLDNVYVSCTPTFSLYSEVDKISTEEAVTIKGYIQAGKEAINNYTVHYTCADSVVRTRTFTGVNIAPGETHHFAFDEKMPIAGSKGKFAHFRMWAGIGTDERVGVNDSVAAAAFVPQKRVVVEEGTGTWCGWCPLGILAFEHIEEVYGDQVIKIAVHNDDIFTVDEYDSHLNFPAFPCGTVNRITYSYPYELVGETTYSFDGQYTWTRYIDEELAVIRTSEIRLATATIKDDVLEVSGKLRFALDADNPTYNIAYVLTENHVEGKAYQINYLADATNPFFGRFAYGQQYGQSRIVGMPFEEVARGIYPAYRGGSIRLPKTVKAGYETTVNGSYSLDGATLNNLDNVYVTALVIDDRDGVILAADRIKLQ